MQDSVSIEDYELRTNGGQTRGGGGLSWERDRGTAVWSLCRLRWETEAGERAQGKQEHKMERAQVCELRVLEWFELGREEMEKQETE